MKPNSYSEICDWFCWGFSHTTPWENPLLILEREERRIGQSSEKVVDSICGGTNLSVMRQKKRGNQLERNYGQTRAKRKPNPGNP